MAADYPCCDELCGVHARSSRGRIIPSDDFDLKRARKILDQDHFRSRKSKDTYS